MSIHPEAVTPLLAALIYLRDNGPIIPADGLCTNINSYIRCNYPDDKQLREAIRQLHRHLMTTWPDSSGDNSFPVDGYEEYFIICADKWSNPRRLQLLNWMIAQLEVKP